MVESTGSAFGIEMERIYVDMQKALDQALDREEAFLTVPARAAFSRPKVLPHALCQAV